MRKSIAVFLTIIGSFAFWGCKEKKKEGSTCKTHEK